MPNAVGLLGAGGMRMNRVLVIGGTGAVGRQVLFELAAKGVEGVALTRHPEASRLPPQIAVVRGDLTLPETLDACLDGMDAVFLVWTAPASAVAAALRKIAKYARRIVFLSAPLKTPHPFFQQPNPLRTLVEQIERVIEDSGLAWTFLRPGIFAANALGWWAPQIRAGDRVRWPYLSVPTAPIDARDIASVAAKTLCEEGHSGAEYVLTGPQSLTQFEQISTIGRVIGRSLRIEEIPPDAAGQELGRVMPQGAVDMLLAAWAAAIGQPAFLTSTVREITGAPARSFLDWVKENSREFRA
jgi:uncharacterized protein YbjT (DUF2867 family)